MCSERPLGGRPPLFFFFDGEAADLFGVEKHVLRDARNRNELDFYRIGKFVRYDLKQLEKWKEQNRNRAVGE